jgi:hypothetical protein
MHDAALRRHGEAFYAERPLDLLVLEMSEVTIKPAAARP